MLKSKKRLLDGFDLDQAINRRFANTSDGAAAGGAPALMSASGAFASILACLPHVRFAGDFENAFVARGAASAASAILAFHGMLLDPFVSSDNHYVLAI